MIAEMELAIHNTIEEKLKSLLGEQYEGKHPEHDFMVYHIHKSRIVESLELLKTDADLNFHFLTTLCASHFPENKGAEFAMMYQLHNMYQNVRIRIKTQLPENELSLPSITHLWPSANWMERQEFDFFGINFEGHPDLRRILNMDEMNYFPLRKEYRLEDAGRDDKDDKFFGR